MDTTNESLTHIDILERAGPHDHLCLLYETRDKQLSCALPFIRTGLERGERCLYIVDGADIDATVAAMRRYGIDVDAAFRRGALEVASAYQTYLQDARFDPGHMVGLLGEAASAAQAAGFAALRVASEMGWALDGHYGTERLIEYESALNRLFPAAELVGLCQYHRTGFPPQLLLDIVRAHPVVVNDGLACNNPYYIPPHELSQWPGPAQVLERMLSTMHAAQQVEEARRSYEGMYREIFETSLVGMALIDTETMRFVHANRAAAQYFDVPSPEALVGTDPLDLVHEEERERVISLITEDRFHNDLRQIHEVRAFDRGGKEIWISGVGTKTNYQGQPAALVSFRDITARKWAEEQLRASEKFSASLLANSPNPILVLNPDASIRYVNPALEALTGYTASELIGTVPPFPWWTEETGHKTIRDLVEAMSEGARRLEELFQRKGGERFWVEITAEPLRSDGDLTYFISNWVDITERKHTEEQLKASEEKYRRLVEEMSDGYAVTKRDRVAFANVRASEILGFTLEEAIGQELVQFVAPQRIDKALQMLEAVQRGDTVSSHYETLMQTKGGQSVHCEVSLKDIAYEGEPGFSILFRDITERKRADEERRRYTRQIEALHAITQTLSQTLELDQLLEFTLARVQEIMDADASAIYFLNWEQRDAVLGAHRGYSDTFALWDGIWHIDDDEAGTVTGWADPLADIEGVLNEAHRSRMAATLEREGIQSHIVAGLWAKGALQGTIVVCNRGVRPFTPEDVELLQAIGNQIGVGIDNARLYEEASSARALRELDRLRGQLLANVSHQLRTPLASIKGFASTLLQPDVEWDRDAQRDFLRHIDQEADRLTRIIADLLEMSRLEAGALRIERSVCHVADIIDSVRNTLVYLTKDHRLEFAVPPGLPLALADSERMGHVLTNLVENAAHNSPAGSEITIEALVTDQEVVVRVVDQGRGIPPQHLDRIFERFYQVEGGASLQGQGMGLGLSICRGIVEANGGRIWAESEVEKGTTFSFTMPLHRERRRRKRRGGNHGG